MQKNNYYLKFLINEDIYLVREDKDSNVTNERSEITQQASDEKKLAEKTIILIEYPENSEITETLKLFLSKILLAVGLKIEDIILFDIGKSDPGKLGLDKNDLSGCTVIGFIQRIPNQFHTIFNRKKYDISNVAGNKVLLADTLGEIYKNKSKKVLLWEKLKELFEIN